MDAWDELIAIEYDKMKAFRWLVMWDEDEVKAHQQTTIDKTKADASMRPPNSTVH